MSRRSYTAAHWGVYEVEQDKAGGPPAAVRLLRRPRSQLDQLDPSVTAFRVARPAVRKSWLDGGPGTATARRGEEPFVEVAWERALTLAADEIARVRAAYGNAAIFGGSYGWSSAGRFHHAQSHMWFDPDGDLERHGNPNRPTLDNGASSLSQGCIAQTCLIEVRRYEGVPPPVGAFDPPRFVARTDASLGDEHRPPVR